jgi:hypothetical protein
VFPSIGNLHREASAKLVQGLGIANIPVEHQLKLVRDPGRWQRRL